MCELECFTILDSSTLELFLLSKFKKLNPKLRRPRIQNLIYEIEILPLLSSASSNKQILLEYSIPTNQETRVRSLIEQNLSIYLKESLFTENGFLWTNFGSDDVFRNVGLLFKYIADYRLIQKSIYRRTGQITDENNLENFKNNLIQNALDDLAEIEIIITQESTKSRDETKVTSMLASVLVPLSLESENTKIGKYLNKSQILSNFVEKIKKKYLSQFQVYNLNEKKRESFSILSNPILYFKNHKFQIGLICFSLFAFYRTRRIKALAAN